MKIYNELVGSYPAVMELPITADEAYTKGTLLTLSSGAATLSGLDTDATSPHMFLCEETMAANAKSTVKASMVLPHLFYEAVSSASLASNNVGTLVTLYTGAAQITATATKGVATIVKKLADKLAVVQFRTIR
jgi:hypothetical protein